jgi:hypothetical protein
VSSFRPKKGVIRSDNEIQEILHETSLSRSYRLLANFGQHAHYRDYVADTVGSCVVLHTTNVLSTSATSLQLISYRALCSNTVHNNMTCR